MVKVNRHDARTSRAQQHPIIRARLHRVRRVSRHGCGLIVEAATRRGPSPQNSSADMMNARYYPWNEVAHLFITGSRVGRSFSRLSLLCLSLGLLPPSTLYAIPLSLPRSLAPSHCNDVLDPGFSRRSRSLGSARERMSP